ncbi:MAG: membrane protein insertase YidC [Thermoanaerobaculales bacterium]
MEKRLLLAFVLSAAILLLWTVLFPPPQRQPGPAAPAEAPVEYGTTVTDEKPVEPGAVYEQPAAEPEREEMSVDAAEVQIAEVEIERRLANERIEVVLSNRGAAIVSYRLLDYEADRGQTLDLIQTVTHPGRALPLQLILADGPDDALYQVEDLDNGVFFRWADGSGNAVYKRVVLMGAGYGLDVDIETTGNRSGAAISVGTGMRDLDAVERDSRLALWGEGIMLADGEITRLKRKKVEEPRGFEPGSLAFVGFEDAYFLNVLRPADAVSAVKVDPLEFMESGAKPDAKTNRALRISVLPVHGRLRGELLGAPKEYDLLQTIDQGVEKSLNFGIFSPISVVFLKALRWIYGVVGNWGLAIILLTLGIRILLFPLMHTSTVSMRKMQKVQPKVKEIQARYKKKKTDPQARAKMNQETMALYKEEGVNPMAGCLPMLVQLPLLWALYQLFLRAIELRHAPFMLWITDLSAKDPYYVTPILMTATMWLQQRLAPQAGDPQQQKLMRMMPLIFGIMFLQFPSGLVLYWLANNVITIIQQEVTLHLVGERSVGKILKIKRKDAGK